MTAFRKYLNHRLRSALILTIVLCILAMIIMQVSTSVVTWNSLNWYDANGQRLEEPITVRRLSVNSFGLIAFILGAMCTLIPIVELGDMKNKRNADLIYALPVSRAKMALAHYASGLINIFTVYTVAYITMTVKILTASRAHLLPQKWILIPCYFALFAVGVCIYSIFTAIFNSANTVVDGCLFVAAWSIIIPLFYIALNDFTSIFTNLENFFEMNLNENSLMPHSAFFVVGYFHDILVGEEVLRSAYAYIPVWCIVGIVCAAVYFYSFARKRAEEIGDLSSTVFGYRVLIPLGVFSMTQAFDEDIVSFIFAALLGVVGYMIYRRSFKIKKNDLITIGAIILCTGVMMALL